MSLLEFLEENYELFSKFDGKLGSFVFPSDITDVFEILMRRANSFYMRKCKDFHLNSKDIFDYRVKKDDMGNCYLEVTGADRKTKVLIIKDGIYKHQYYNEVVGTGFSESSLIKILDLYQREKLKLANISKRFLRDDVLPVDLVTEFDAENLKKYYQYLDKLYNNMKETTIRFEAPVNTGVPHSEPTKSSKERVNDVIDYEVRKQALMNYKPISIIHSISNNGTIYYDGYVYEINGHIVTINEPINGTSYTMFLDFGPKEYVTSDMLEANMRAVMESKESVLVSDDAIIRKSHTDMNSFLRNLNTFFVGDKSNYKFSVDLEKAQEVYGNHSR